jgi:hypothetical protein
MIRDSLAKLADASTTKCKPLDRTDVWQTISEAKPRTEIVYNVEPFRGAIREGAWMLIWRTPLPSSIELYNITQDPSEKTNLAAANPEVRTARDYSTRFAERTSARL